ncbi:MAG: HlyD family efflux transporter periplasmic adaptor subunit [Pseudomonadota bacterium]
MRLSLPIIAIIAAAIAAAVGYFIWAEQAQTRLPEGIVSANGRIEADQLNVATKRAGRVVEVTVDEGDMVDAGQALARMDTAETEAQLKRAEAEVRRAERAKQQASATVIRALSQLEFAEIELRRAQDLHEKGFTPTEFLDRRANELRAADADYQVAVASVEEANAAIVAAMQEAERLAIVLEETVLTAPRRGRVQYRLAEPGEVLPAGGRVLTLLDLADIHMTVFLPSADAGLLEIGSEARLVLDPIPQYVVPARVSFVDAEAQFTPKAVETAEERAKLMFRIKLQIDPALLEKYESRVKSGVRGVAYLKLLDETGWPDRLLPVLPE